MRGKKNNLQSNRKSMNNKLPSITLSPNEIIYQTFPKFLEKYSTIKAAWEELKVLEGEDLNDYNDLKEDGALFFQISLGNNNAVFAFAMAEIKEYLVSGEDNFYYLAHTGLANGQALICLTQALQSKLLTPSTVDDTQSQLYFTLDPRNLTRADKVFLSKLLRSLRVAKAGTNLG